MSKLKNLLKKLQFRISPYILVSVVLIAIIAISLLGRRSQQDTLNAFIDARLSDDAEGIVELMPNALINNLISDGTIESKDDLVAKINRQLEIDLHEYSADELKTFRNKISYIEDADDGISTGTIRQLQQIFGRKAKNICIIYYSPTIQTKSLDGSDYDQQLPRESVALVKIGQSWYVILYDNLVYWL